MAAEYAIDTPLEDPSEQESSVRVEDVTENSDEEEEEDECRVCRGPAEEGRPLFAPCKCSGSIGLVHQDCLVSWLDVTRGDGRCELCKTKFQFDPQYAENAPDHLPVHEVILGLSSRFLAKWLPLALRILIAASLWLVIAPLLTSCLYHGWMHRPASIIPRMTKDIVPSDIVSGATIAAIIIISFLSLMSFADFLRVHWQRPPRHNEGIDEQQQRDDSNNDIGADDNDHGAIDDALVKYVSLYQDSITTDEEPQGSDPDDGNPGLKYKKNDEKEGERMILERQATQGHVGDNDSIDVWDAEYGVNGRIEGPLPRLDHEDNGNGDEWDHDDPPPPLAARDDNMFNEVVEDILNEEEGNGAAFHDRNVNNRNEEPILRRNIEREERPFDPMDPVLQDDQVDMEINLALDELLGLRGPLSTLVRNLLWLLAFNATYLGIFAFVPKTVGSTVYTGLLNTTLCDKFVKAIPYMHSEDQEKLTLLKILSSVKEESLKQNTTFKIPDLATVTLGYFSIAAMIVLMRYGWILSKKIRKTFGLENPNLNEEHGRTRRGREDRINGFDDREAMENGFAGGGVGGALDATVTIVKVGVLLFLKMFLLPLILGLWLDASTMTLFGHNTSHRIVFAGGDLFSFIFLHWVAGITFMLLVTVFLLQLREVAHPDLLARLIRPQEPQPDLLGNLMNETVSTHMKRMFLSLGIYAPLLTMHVTLPVKLFVLSGLGTKFTFFRLNFWYVAMPQMQIPIELIIFHLSMLALLERYKNSIGGLQHSWMVFMCRRMGLTEYLLPCSVEKFQLVGTKKIFLAVEENASGATVDPFWYELIEKDKWADDFIETNLQPEESVFIRGDSKSNGKRVLSSTAAGFIQLPAPSIGEVMLLPTKIGGYRLDRRDFKSPPNTENLSSAVIAFWKEIPGDEIPRPPEGWDDLGAGGAFVQGRWAWGKEKKSVVENSVAQATSFRSSETGYRPMHLLIKVCVLILLSWLAITSTILGVLSAPLAVGRSFYYLFRIPREYIHDPLAFCVGACLFFPIMSLLIKSIKVSEGDIVNRFRTWVSRFHAPPRQKLKVLLESLVLWFGIAPMLLGVSYEIFAVKKAKWFAREESAADFKSLLLCWVVGTVVLNTWAFMSYFSVFTKVFWANIGNGILEPPLDENGNEIPQNNANNEDRVDNAEEEQDTLNDPHRAWQGKRGRIARCFNVWRSALLGWEWEAVDRVRLLEESTRPVTKQLASALVGSSLSFQFSLYMIAVLFRFEKGGLFVPSIGLIEHGLFRMVLFRTCMASHVMLQLCSASKARLEGWFHAAHEAARDDRYLIGEVLMNHNPDDDAQ